MSTEPTDTMLPVKPRLRGVLHQYAFFVSLVFATVMRDEPRAQLRTGAMMFGGFVAAAVVIGWLMLPLPL
jgi:hypothetical protein